MLDFNTVLETENVKLRPMKEEDLKSFRSLTCDNLMWIYFTKDLSVTDELKSWMKDAFSEAADRKRLAFTIIEKNKNTIAGSTSLGNISNTDKRVEIGWTWIGKEFQGTGLNAHVKSLLLKFCFEENDFERVECKTDVLNVQARIALSRIGMVEEGILRSHTLMTHNRRRDTIYYSILRSEWEKVKIKNGW